MGDGAILILNHSIFRISPTSPSPNQLLPSVSQSLPRGLCWFTSHMASVCHGHQNSINPGAFPWSTATPSLCLSFSPWPSSMCHVITDVSQAVAIGLLTHCTLPVSSPFTLLFFSTLRRGDQLDLGAKFCSQEHLFFYLLPLLLSIPCSYIKCSPETKPLFSDLDSADSTSPHSAWAWQGVLHKHSTVV